MPFALATKNQENAKVPKKRKKNPFPESNPSPKELLGMFFSLNESKSPARACLPYVRDITEPLTQTRPRKTLQEEFPSPKFKFVLLHLSFYRLYAGSRKLTF